MMPMFNVSPTTYRQRKTVPKIKVYNLGEDIPSDPPTLDYQSGYDQAQADMKAELEHQKQAYEAEIARLKQENSQITSELSNGINTYLEELEQQLKDEVIDLSFSIAELIIGRELSSHSSIELILRCLLDDILKLEGVSLRLSQADLSLIAEGDLQHLPVEIVADHRVQKGEFLLESNQGFLDGRLDDRLRTIKGSLLQALEMNND